MDYTILLNPYVVHMLFNNKYKKHGLPNRGIRITPLLKMYSLQAKFRLMFPDVKYI